MRLQGQFAVTECPQADKRGYRETYQERSSNEAIESRAGNRYGAEGGLDSIEQQDRIAMPDAEAEQSMVNMIAIGSKQRRTPYKDHLIAPRM